MKLFRFGLPGAEKPGVLHGDARLDCSAFGEDYDEQFFESGGLARLRAWLDVHAQECPRLADEVRFGAPIRRPSKLVCIGLNYRKHAEETGAAIPAEPILFFKSTTALCGPNDALMLPKGSRKTDWEVELAVVIGKTARHVPVDDALSYVAGYALHNDYSEREFQLERGGQWVKGKSCDTFAPLGPYLVTTEELQHDALELWLNVNGERLQTGHTSDMVFGVPQLVSYVSQFMTLLAGDVISTGTPAGVGLGCKPPRFLRAGDVVELGIQGLGSSRQVVIPFHGG
jgi:2-keto-4-pentenoate hydratase/2-oxohepta-3-ene-1,7-dioic acid hydratase in catechol pathway